MFGWTSRKVVFLQHRLISSSIGRSQGHVTTDKYRSAFSFLRKAVASPSVEDLAKEIEENVQLLARKPKKHQSAILLLAGHCIKDYQLVLDISRKLKRQEIPTSLLGSQLATFAAIECQNPIASHDKTQLQYDLIQELAKANFHEAAKSLYYALRSDHQVIPKSVYEQMTFMFIRLHDWEKALDILADTEGKDSVDQIEPVGILEKVDEMYQPLDKTWIRFLNTFQSPNDRHVVEKIGEIMENRGYELHVAYYVALLKTSRQTEDPNDIFNAYTSEWTSSLVKAYLDQCEKRNDNAMLENASRRLVESKMAINSESTVHFVDILLRNGMEEMATEYLREVEMADSQLADDACRKLAFYFQDRQSFFRLYTKALPSTSWNPDVFAALFAASMKHQDWKGIIYACNELKRCNVPLSPFSSLYVQALVHDGQGDEGRSYLRQMISNGEEIRLTMFKYVPEDIFEECIPHLTVSELQSVCKLSIKPRHSTLIDTVYRCVKEEDRKYFVGFKLVALLDAGKIEEAMEIFRRLETTHIASLHASILRNMCMKSVLNQDWNSIILIHNRMKEAEIEMDCDMEGFYIDALAKSGQRDLALEKYRRLRKQGFKFHRNVYRSLIYEAEDIEVFQDYILDRPVSDWENSVVVQHFYNCTKRRDWGSILVASNRMKEAAVEITSEMRGFYNRAMTESELR